MTRRAFKYSTVLVVGVLGIGAAWWYAGHREGQRRELSVQRLRQIALACNMWEACHKRRMPVAMVGPNGRPLLSWRVAILPYIEMDSLYQKFHLDEPWDSEHNLRLAAETPWGLQSPSGAQPGKTSYLAVIRRDSEKAGRAAAVDVVVEADPDHQVVWTAPDDLDYDPATPLEGLGEAYHAAPWAGSGGFPAVAVRDDWASAWRFFTPSDAAAFREFVERQFAERNTERNRPPTTGAEAEARRR